MRTLKYLVTGTAGFVGFHTASRLLQAGHAVAGVDAFVPYYDVALKTRRHDLLKQFPGFREYEADLADADRTAEIFAAEKPDRVIHLAAQAGVRYSLEHPESYLRNNVVATFNVLEELRKRPVEHFLFASTSSAYGASRDYPYRETQAADTPLTIYAASKRSAELMCHAHAHLWGQPITAFRFFTVYGPWGRPDMAFFKFTDRILKGLPIEVYNHGRMWRDFTYVDDLVRSIESLADAPPEAGRPVADFDSVSPVAPYRLVNIGAGDPVALEDFIAAIERHAGREAVREYLPMQPGEVEKTFADTRLLRALTGFTPEIGVDEGVRRFVAWYRDYYGAS